MAIERIAESTCHVTYSQIGTSRYKYPIASKSHKRGHGAAQMRDAVACTLSSRRLVAKPPHIPHRPVPDGVEHAQLARPSDISLTAMLMQHARALRASPPLRPMRFSPCAEGMAKALAARSPGENLTGRAASEIHLALVARERRRLAFIGT